MKKLLYLLLIFSCNTKSSKPVVSSEYPKSFNFKDEDTDFYGWKIVLGGDSHEYLRSNYSSEGLVVIHYPDCKKCLSKK
jgi:hypothetical protein